MKPSNEDLLHFFRLKRFVRNGRGLNKAAIHALGKMRDAFPGIDDMVIRNGEVVCNG